jgi:hypothetical protein
MSEPRRQLSGEQQGAALRHVFRSFRQLARGNPYIWEGQLMPVDGIEYRIRITYYPNLVRPRVSVVEPVLVPRELNEKIPHTFRSGGICLHLNEEWDPSMFIHQTIVPWTSLWLYYYEVWLSTGKWRGGGHGTANRTSTPDDDAKKSS